MVSSLFLVISALVLNNLAVKYGDAAVASFGVSIRLIMVPQTLCTGICMGSIPLFAYTYGAGNRERLRAALKVAVLLSIGTSAIFSIPVWAFRDWALYLAGGPSIITTGDQVLTALLFSTVFYALVMLLVAWFQACGKGVAAVVLTASVGVFFFRHGLRGRYHFFGFTGLTWAFPVTQIGGVARSGWRCFGRVGARSSGSLKKRKHRISRRATSLTQGLLPPRIGDTHRNRAFYADCAGR